MTTAEKSKANGKGCWYEVFIHACPICGRSEEFRERRWTPKPEDPLERYNYEDIWDYCNAL